MDSPINPPILDLSQRTTPSNPSDTISDHWIFNSSSVYTDEIPDEEIPKLNIGKDWDINRPLTDQVRHTPMKEDCVSDSSSINKSKLELAQPRRKPPSSSSYRIVIHNLQPHCPLSSSNFLWSKYLSLINERAVSDEFFDHYLASIHSGFEPEMKLEYCYDIQKDLYWLTQIQLVSQRLILLHFVGIPEDDTSNDFWADVYGQRCHPIGWCRENSKLMLPPPIVTKRAFQQTTNNTITNGIDKQVVIKKEDGEELQTPPNYLFNKEIGINPSEQLKSGMLLEIQEFTRPWTVWFARIVNNHGGRLHLRYILSSNEAEEVIESNSSDIHIFYLDWRVHFIGWTAQNSPTYFYDIPSCVSIPLDKQLLIDLCSTKANSQFHPPNLFADQEEIRKHRFTEGMKLEVFDWRTQNIYPGSIGQVHNEYYFDVVIDNEQTSTFVAYATHPHILPAHWAAEHRFALMKGKGIRQSEDYWTHHTDKTEKNDVASERCFNLITLNSTGNNRAEPGMKMEMVYNFNGEDRVFAVTLVHVVDHLMWLRVDNPSLFDDERLFYHVLPINSLDVFPVGWAKFNQLDLVLPLEHRIDIHTYEENRYDLFSSVTHSPRIPRVYFNEIYQLTLYVNIRCFSGPHLCTSRLARIPSQFGPGPYRLVLIDMFHHLLSASSTCTNTLRALRRLEHPAHTCNLKTEYIKAAKKSSKLIRPISLPIDPYSVNQYLRHICTQLETCPNLISIKRVEEHCPDQCHILINTFALSVHSKHKRTQLRTAQNRQRKQKSLLCHLKPSTIPPPASTPPVEDLPSSETLTSDISSTVPPPPGSDRKTRGFRVHIEPRTHTVTRTNRKQKSTSAVLIKQEPIEPPPPSDPLPIKEAKRSRLSKNKRPASPVITMNILSNPTSPPNRTKKKRRSPPMVADLPPSTSSTLTIPKLEVPSPTTTSLLQPTFPLPPIDTRNPVTWNVNDVCSYLNQSGCSFALKTIKEQEIDGAALLLLDDLPKVQDLLEFKLGPAVKFCHVVEQLRTQVIDTFHSSPSLKNSRLSTKNTS